MKLTARTIQELDNFEKFMANRSNLELSIEALRLLRIEYRNALSNDASFLVLLEIKLRMDNIKLLLTSEVES